MWYSQEPYQGRVTHNWKIITIKEVLLEKWGVNAPHWGPCPQPAPGRPASRTLDFEGAYFWESQKVVGHRVHTKSWDPGRKMLWIQVRSSNMKVLWVRPTCRSKKVSGDAGRNWSSPWGRSTGNDRLGDLIPQTWGEGQRPFWSLPPLKRIRPGTWPHLPACRPRNWDPLEVSLTRQATCMRNPWATSHLGTRPAQERAWDPDLPTNAAALNSGLQDPSSSCKDLATPPLAGRPQFQKPKELLWENLGPCFAHQRASTTSVTPGPGCSHLILSSSVCLTHQCM